MIMNRTKKELIREGRRKNQIPDSLLNNEELLDCIRNLPENYNFELPKTLWHIKLNNSKRVALQFPEGLIIFSITIAEIIEKFTGVETIIMGDIAYGACCIDDFTSSIYGCDMIVHYGHSCLVPIDMTPFSKVLYVFVSVKIDKEHFMSTIRKNFNIDTSSLALISTIQFASDLYDCAKMLTNEGYRMHIPQTFPLSKGEVLGCTAPFLPEDITEIIFLGDGRFHIESVMIQSPDLPAYKYDPYSNEITREVFDISSLVQKQEALVNHSMKIDSVGRFGIVFGTLGRQGNEKVFKKLREQIVQSGRVEPFSILVSEITPEKLSYFNNSIHAWVQIACPRLSIDWSSSFTRPLLTPYELSVVTGHVAWMKSYPMDYYSADSLGPWTPNHNIMANSKLRKRAPKSY